MPLPKKNHGSESNKNTQFLRTVISSESIHMDGQHLVTQPTRVHTTAQSVAMFASEEPLLMLITRLASMLDSKFPELMLRSCQANGNFRLDLALELNKVTTFGPLDISS